MSRKKAKADQRRAEDDARSKLYQDAAEQVGHDKAPVRFAAFMLSHALRMSGQKQRQASVEVLCAYLRMPVLRHPQYEHLYRAPIDDGDALAMEVGRYRHIYNTIRPHQALGDRTPRAAYLSGG